MSLRSLSDKVLHTRIRRLVRIERETTIDILDHLNEIERRRLHLALGFSSLFDYCTSGPGYSASGAGRRVQVARCIRRCPKVGRALRGREVNLTTVSIVAGLLTRENEAAVLERIRGKTQREVEVIAARHRPPSRVRDRIRPVVVRMEPPVDVAPVVCAGGSGPGQAPLLGSKSRVADHSQNGSGLDQALALDPGARATSAPHDDSGGVPQSAATNHSQNGSAQPAQLIEKMLVQFAAAPAFVKKLERARALISARHRGQPPLEAVFEAALDEFLRKHDPMSRHQRRVEASKRKQKPGLKTGSGEKPGPTPEPEPKTKPSRKPQPHLEPEPKHQPSRHIPAAIRDAVHVRDSGRCAFVGKSGRRCAATHNLQVDHVMPFARGGPNAATNLRLLCAQHNRLEARRIMGVSVDKYKRRE